MEILTVVKNSQLKEAPKIQKFDLNEFLLQQTFAPFLKSRIVDYNKNCCTHENK